KVVRVMPDLYYARAAADESVALVRTHCRAHGEITAATFRDLIGASRKFAIAFLDWCDRTGVTVRVGDLRKLRRCPPPRSRGHESPWTRCDAVASVRSWPKARAARARGRSSSG